jgi:REP element-mobilizing transposase RayT
LLQFGPDELPIVAEAVGGAVRHLRYTCYAAAIMPEHVHLIIRKHRDRAEQMIEKLQMLSRERLWEVGLRGL